jgi:hypothetical protein
MIALVLAALTLAGGVQAPPAPGFTITFDGGIFKHQTYRLAPFKATYANTYFRAPDDRASRLALESEPAADGLGLRFDAAPRLGVTSFDRKDEDDPNRNPYMRFDLRTMDWTLIKGYRLDLVHVDVTVTRLDPPGGRIEGTYRGTYELCTLPGDGGGNCTARAPFTIAGEFSVVRLKDHRVN